METFACKNAVFDPSLALHVLITLQFAAAAGHVELCAMLIRAGADKSALVYEGPSDSIL